MFELILLQMIGFAFARFSYDTNNIFCFLLSSQILLAPIGDKFGSRRTLAVSLLVSALAMVIAHCLFLILLLFAQVLKSCEDLILISPGHGKTRILL